MKKLNSIITGFKPAPELERYVAGYWLVHDPAGVYANELVTTLPILGCVLGVNLAEPNRFEDRVDVPNVSLVGLQQAKISYRASNLTKFTMAILTLEGCVAVLDGAAAPAVGALAELDTLLGPTVTNRLHTKVLSASSGREIARAFDQWINDQIATRAVNRAHRIGKAARYLQTHSVASTARELSLSRRQLYRMFVGDLGVGPKLIGSLQRFSSSVSGVMTADLDPVTGYADQAHHIRDWGVRVGISPGRYAALGQSELARQFSRASSGNLHFYA